MRLLHFTQAGDLRFTKDFIDNIPPYAILSHTWGDDDDEVAFKDVAEGTHKNKIGYDKIRFCGKQAASDSLNYFWVDTCCINRADYTELHTAINSMFRWYENATKCYVYLTDVSTSTGTGLLTWEDSFRKSRWFTRGWTLQELLAPLFVEFFSKECHRLGDKKSLQQQISDITAIPITVLQGALLSSYNIEERMYWSNNRQTKREEDRAYSLLGIFGVNMPLIYGEGMKSAFTRLREEIDKRLVPKRDPSSPSSERSLTEDERHCVSQFRNFDIEDYRRLLPKPAQGTCRWVLDHPSFSSWLEKTENAVLWLVGHPGCGKTTLSSFLAHYFDHFTESDNPRNVLVYYCDDKITQQKDANAIISGLIFQLIQRHRSLIRHVRKVYEMHGSSLVKSLSALWGIFRKILGAHKGPFYIVIDALDECENASRLQLLEAIYELITNPPQPSMSGKHVKFLISSRPTLSQLSAGPSQVLQDQISLDEDQPGLNTDLRLFIQQRVDEVSARSKLPLDVQNFLLQTLCSKADRSFLWAHLTLSSIENSLLASMKNFRDIIGKIPPDLETAYSEFLFAISSSHQNDASRLLKLILSSSRPLHLEEINIAFTIEPSHFSTEDVTRDCQPDIARTVQGILGPLVRISDSRVSLVHQSAKDFLLRTHGISPSFPSGFAISPETSALEMSNACILYLLLDQFDCDLYSAKASPTELSVGSFESTEEPAFEVLDGGFFWGNEDMDLETAKLFHEPDARDQDISPLISSTYELYAYASLHWAEAFAICEQFATAEIREGARTLLDVDNNSCRNWLRYYSANVTAARVDELINFEPITLAAYFNLQLTLTALLQNSTGPSHTAIDQGLFWAARVGHARIIATLLEAGADPNGRGPDRKTPIIAAAEHSHLDCIITLLTDTRTDLSVMDRRGRNALSFACGNGQESIVKELLTRAPRTANQLDYFGTTPFFWATGGGYIPVVITMLRQAGLDINHQDNTGRTVTSWAAGDGMDEVLKRLIKLKGIEANLADKKGKSPLIWAAGNGHAGAVSILSRNRVVNKGCLDKDRRGAISWACGGGHAAALRVLIQNGCPGLDDEDIDGWTPLAWSIQTDSPESVQALISTGRINIERRDRQGRTALSWAVEYGHVSVVRVLLKGGADPEVKSNNGTTPIMVAEKFKHMEILDELKLNRGQV